MNTFYVYILASQRNGTLYVGFTNDIERRVQEHKQKIVKGFTAKYNVNILVYFEEFNNSEMAILKERQMKKWKRAWKLKLIEKENPNWKDLSEEWYK
ncbi:MAG: GIY-YIG nuclease family protein [Flavobacteriales bacterium]|nr:GIY-YIG nuclease family protein [Flavobacteriales bacterium]MCB9363292.1 GIY-YIG nuclease family protein [Flavobacteriales bacterium]